MAKLTEEQRAQRAAARARREAFAAEEEDRLENERREKWRREGTRLSWEEYRAGVACRGCGEPMYDGLGDWPGLMYLTDEQKCDHDAMEERFRELHPNCKSSRWSVEESRVSHCCWCCPPPPLGPKKLQELSKLVKSFPSYEERKKDLDAWRLTLTCGHGVDYIQHREDSYVSASVVDCPECQARRGIVHSERIGPAFTEGGLLAEREEAEQARLAAELAEENAKLLRQQQRAAATKRRIDEIEQRLCPQDRQVDA